MTESSAGNTLFHTHRLTNGLQIVAQPMADFESVAVAYYVRTGARDEQDQSISGVSHFLEHMMFKGTRTLDWQQITLEFNKIGAELNASTSVEATIYYARVLGEYLPRAVELLSDMMYPRLAESDFETEKEVIINEIARAEDNPRGLAYRRMLHTYFADHPLGHYVLGSRESIRVMHIEQMRSYWQNRYAANNIILSVAGNFAWDALVALAEQHSSKWDGRIGSENTERPARIVTPYEPMQSMNNIIVDQKLKQQILYLTMPCVAAEDPDYYAAVLGASVLGARDGSRLYWNIRHKGLAESCGSSIRALEGTGVFIIDASVTPQQAPLVLQLIRSELKTLLEQGIQEDELRRAKDKWISSAVLGSESTFSRMYALASDWITEGRPVSIEEKLQRIEKVTLEDVMRTLRRFPLNDKQVLTALGPLSEAELIGA